MTHITNPQKTTDRQNIALSLQLLRLYATPHKVSQAYLLMAYGCALPTFEEFVRALSAMRN